MNTKENLDLEFDKKVANNIKKYITLNNISLKSLSLDTGISLDYLTNLPKHKLTIEDIYKISKVLNVSIDTFFHD